MIILQKVFKLSVYKMLVALFLSIFVIFFMLSMLVNYFFILGRNFKKTILISLLMTVIAIFSHVFPQVIYQYFF
ncbi:hypothetical protein EAE90_08680 [Photorhabdus caribbeanensis]|nr:hypothetical protein [Photorhabdus caribbeanensis]